MSQRETFQIVEIDLDYCTRTFGVGACLAALGSSTPRKCYNTFGTCKYLTAYNKGTKTYTFCTATSSMPVGQNYLPFLKSVDERSGSVNIAGAQKDLKAFGTRATITAKFVDSPYNDALTDKYVLERISGAAQIDEGGYNPLDRLTFWTKLKARNRNYAGRPMRVKQCYIENGAVTVETTRHYTITEIDGPDDSGNVSVKAKDILALADDDKAVAPKANTGYLKADVTVDETSITLLPAGIGNIEYAASGWVVIGSEICGFTRAGDVLTLTRGQRGTVASTHSVNDVVQQTFSVRGARIDEVLYDLLVNYAQVPAAYITLADWQEEAERWAPHLRLNADICKPEGINALVSEMLVLGVSVWWDDVAQKIRLQVVRPVDDDPVVAITDRNNIVKITQKDNDDKRLTRVLIRFNQIDPTRALSTDNFAMQRLIIDTAAESEDNFNDVKQREINCRWLNDGNSSLARISAKRILQRFSSNPAEFEITLDHKDDILSLVDVVSLSSRVAADESGKPVTLLMQVTDRNGVMAGHQFKIGAQLFEYTKRYAYFTENTRPVYGSSTEAQKLRGAYWSDAGANFSDGRPTFSFA